jgi:dihydrofolate reductase
MPGEAHVFIACSLDGFIAGPDDDLSWLTGPDSAAADEDAGAESGADAERDDHGFSAFFARVGALLMGRRTHDVVAGFDEWYYGDKPVLVATTRPLDNPAAPTVRAVSGTPEEMLAQAREVAGDKNVYVDGGALIRSCLDAGLIDEMTVSVIPIILGDGIPLFAGVTRRHKLDLVEMSPSGGKLVQLRYRPRGR